MTGRLPHARGSVNTRKQVFRLDDGRVADTHLTLSGRPEQLLVQSIGHFEERVQQVMIPAREDT
jgi:hypothetical protein